MPDPALHTISDFLYWSYANLSMASKAAWDGAIAYSKTHFIIRNRTWSGLRTGKVKVGSPVKDVRPKARNANRCVYCGSYERLSNDHMVPTTRGGRESGDNIVCACRSCNSSKGGRDLLEWYAARGKFPRLFVLRLYLKEVINFCETHGLLNLPIDEAPALPFSLAAIPREYPHPRDLRAYAWERETLSSKGVRDDQIGEQDAVAAPDAPPLAQEPATTPAE